MSELEERIKPERGQPSEPDPRTHGNRDYDAKSAAAPHSGQAGLSDEELVEVGGQVLHTARLGVAVYDRNLRYVAWNPFLEQMFGLRAAEALGKHDSELLPFIKEEGLDALLKRALAGETACCDDFAFFVPKSGCAGWGSSLYTPLRDSSGAVIGVLATLQDITPLKLAQQALRQSEERYRTVVESAADVIYMVSLDYAFISLNQAFERITGWRRADWIGKSFLTLLHPDDLPVAARMFQRVLRGELAPPFELRFASSSGEYLVGECTAAPQLENGRVVFASGIVRDITARKRVEDALRNAEREYRSIVHNALDGIFRSTPEGRFTLVNPALAEMLGYDSPEDLIDSVRGISDDFYADPERRSEYKRLMKEQGVVDRFENRALRKDGSVIWISESGRAVRGEDGQILYYEGAIKDITDRKGAAEALRRSEEKYRELIENINDAVFATDEHAVVTYVSPIVEVNAGYKPSELIGRPLVEVVYPEDRPKLLERFQEASAGEVEPMEYRVVAKSGEVRWVRSSIRAVFAVDRVVGLRGVIADITNHKRVEAHLERLATAVEQAGESILITDAAGVIQYVNPAFERTSGYSREEAIGQNPRILKSEKQDGSFYREMWRTISRGEVWTGRFINKRKNKTLFEEEAAISPVRDEFGRIVNYVGVKRDVTKEVELEKQLLHSQKMEAVGRLAGGVAHDFNNLLTAIIGYGQLLASRLEAGDPLRFEVQEILDAGHRAAALTSQLLAFSRRQTLVPRNINLNETIDNLMKMLRRIIGEDVELVFQASPRLSPVFADPGQIEQVIMNLAVNARDAMATGGKLIIETRNVAFDSAYCREHPWARPGEYVQISVSDTGVGIDAETQRRIFEPFFTTKDMGKGTGLGLAVVYGIIKQHDGFIHVYSEPGHGTTFRLYLVAQQELPQEENHRMASKPRGGSETILVAEDEATLRELARTTLESLGYRVMLAGDGEEAVQTYESASDKIDLVILDLIMPRMGGREAYKRMSELRGDECPVIFMTGYAPEVLMNELATGNGDELVQKPYGLNELGRRVRDLLDAHALRPQK